MADTTSSTLAAKWTRVQTWYMLDQIEELAADEYIITLSQALLHLKCYQQLWSCWKKKWELDGELMDRIYYIEQLFINKLEEAALYRRLNPSACYFLLRNSYGYSLKGERDLPAHLQAELDEPATEATPEPQSAATPRQRSERALASGADMHYHHPDQQDRDIAPGIHLREADLHQHLLASVEQEE